MPRVYLAGPIAHLTYEEATGWREVAKAALAEHGIEAFSPMRAKEFLSQRGRIGIGEYQDVLASDSGIVARDRHDVQNADLMIANLFGAPKVSVGTPVEYGWADAFGVPVITIIEKEGSPYDHPFTRRLSAYRVESLESALEVTLAVLLA